MKQVIARLIEVIPKTCSVTSFRLGVSETLDFQAGQFMLVTLNVEGCEQSKYLSFSNSPTEKGYIEFTKKMTESVFSKALKGLTTGDAVKIKMPMGSFILDETASKHAFLSGGIGITPIRSMLKYSLDRNLPFDKVLFYSNHSTEDILYRSEFEEMAQSDPELKVVFSLDTLDVCPPGWKGRCGFINAGMIREELPDYEDRTFYVCGPPVMVKSLTSILKDQLKIRAEKIRAENFAGY